MRFLGIATVLMCGLVVAACGGQTSSPSAPTPPTSPTPPPQPAPPPTDPTPDPVTIVMPIGATGLTTTAYVPNPATVPVGSTVTWVNNDSDFHTATSTTTVFDSGNMPPGASFSFTFRSAGSFPYLCVFHPNMIGVVNVQ